MTAHDPVREQAMHEGLREATGQDWSEADAATRQTAGIASLGSGTLIERRERVRMAILRLKDRASDVVRHFVLVLLALATGWCATPDEVIVIVKRQRESVPVTAAGTAAAVVASNEPRTIEEVWDRWFNIPGQVWLDTPSGKKPLFGFDNVYDANGFPRPRIPDPYTYAAVTNPTDPEAMRNYLDWRNAVIKRVNFVANNMPEHAYNFGMIGPKNVEVPKNRPVDAKAVGDYSAIEPGSLGTPLVEPGKARELGANPAEIPRLPGKPGVGGIEVYWFWHHRCNHCLKMARDWYAFQAPVRKAGYKIMSINMSPLRNDAEIEAASYEVASTLEIWQVAWGEDCEYSSNTLDWNGTGKALGIAGTPTLIFINRNGNVPRIERLVGPQDAATMRETLAQVAGWDPGTWPPPPVGGAAPAEPQPASDTNTTPLESLGR